MTATDRRRRLATRALAGLGMASGMALLVRPQQVVDRIGPAFPAHRLWLVRALGSRLLVQHGAVLLVPDRALVRVGSAVDLLHAASMVPFVASPQYGRAAQVSGALAAIYAAAALAVAPRRSAH
ncbi:hypothetical protein [Blastococcus sp. CT_GayMR16]|uniref:hypothetical protein n=1 Tax=Blastococcus sp. CT_GayMR16 TaxID=2559607 RepID=UPI001073617B|nr:hypothetical protein [Blastococcus sp. CT_GayMR16]TFV88478.1 hypothetical protein E4P38_09885 [Blastococcus sp. CT_GayMR16]